MQSAHSDLYPKVPKMTSGFLCLIGLPMRLRVDQSDELVSSPGPWMHRIHVHLPRMFCNTQEVVFLHLFMIGLKTWLPIRKWVGGGRG